MPRRPNINCSVCDTPYYKRKCDVDRTKNNRHYCSMKCYGFDCRKTKVCPGCDKEYTGKKASCSRACSNKLRTGIKYFTGARKDIAKSVKALRSRLFLLRGPQCEKCRFSNVKALHVHHKIRRCDGGTNELDNLELICANCHCIHHGNTEATEVGSSNSFENYSTGDESVIVRCD